MIYIGLGSNLRGAFADSETLLRAALAAMPSHRLRVLRVSRFYRNPAVGRGAQPDYINAAAAVETLLAPAATLAALQKIERQFGRVRRTPATATLNNWQPRTLDLDIIDYRGQVSGGAGGASGVIGVDKMSGAACPNLPHPRAHLRDFVLLPLRDIAPAWTHPQTHTPLTELLSSLPPTKCEIV